MNSAVIKLEYAVRGPLVIRAGEIQKELQQKVIFYFILIFNYTFFLFNNFIYEVIIVPNILK